LQTFSATVAGVFSGALIDN